MTLFYSEVSANKDLGCGERADPRRSPPLQREHLCAVFLNTVNILLPTSY